MAEQKNTRRVKLTRSIVLNGDHAEKGHVYDMGHSLAHRIVGEGSAEYVDSDEAPTTVNRMVHPGHADPAPSRVVDGPAPKVTEKEAEKPGKGDKK